LSTEAVGAVVGVRGGVKFYSGAPAAARRYVENDCARCEDYYLSEGQTVCGLGGATPTLTCANAPIQTLKRNDHAAFGLLLVSAD